jgi:predicted AAA+ superfamily ATPase
MLKRRLFYEIGQHIGEKEYTIITGARQTGKTTLLLQLQDELLSENKSVYYLTLEDPEVLTSLNEHPENIFNYLTISKQDKTHLLVDEVQYLDNPSNFLKLLFDKYASNLKIVATGSSAFYIDTKFKNSLAGRKRLFTLYTLDFDEFTEFKTGNTFLANELVKIRNSKKYHSIKRRELKLLFNEYLIFGGYPAVVLAGDFEKKKLLLKDLVHSYLQKDIYEARVRDEKKFYNLLILLANQTGNLLNINELSNTLGISGTSVENYIYVLRKSFHVHLIRPFYKNIRKELVKMPKIYFNDPGFRNTILSIYQNIETRLDKGALIENYAFIRLRQKYELEYLKFWRTTSGNEVDFVLDDPGASKKEAVEIKFNSASFNKKKYIKFLETYPEFNLQLRAYIAGDNTTDILAL